jgi:hypothetical protein
MVAPASHPAQEASRKAVEGRAAWGARDGPASHPQRSLILVLEVAIVVVMSFIVRPGFSEKPSVQEKCQCGKDPSS